MSDTDPTPFRRFPYGPALLCAACLAMCGWTWMRYSYCWSLDAVYVHDRTQQMHHRKWPHDALIEVRSKQMNLRTDGLLLVHVLEGSQFPTKVVLVHTSGGLGRLYVLQTYVQNVRGLEESYVVVVGKNTQTGMTLVAWPAVSSPTSRFHPTSIAGLVVGAMGVFVFGLYLRSWLRERKTAA